jgi:hypothetical protein
MAGLEQIRPRENFLRICALEAKAIQVNVYLSTEAIVASDG